MKDWRRKRYLSHRKGEFDAGQSFWTLLVSCVQKQMNVFELLKKLNTYKIFLKIFFKWLAKVSAEFYKESLVWDDVLYIPMPNYFVTVGKLQWIHILYTFDDMLILGFEHPSRTYIALSLSLCSFCCRDQFIVFT